MTVAILKLEHDQTIPRPFNRVTGVAEAAEVVANFEVRTDRSILRSERDIFVAMSTDAPTEYLEWDRLDTEQPVRVVHLGGGRYTKFYAFTEA